LRLQNSRAVRRSSALIAAALIFGAATGFATEIPLAKGPISVDGELDDTGWQDAKVVRLIHLAQLRLVRSFNSKISTDLFTQISSLDEIVSLNLRFRYNLREGTDLYVVFSESMWTNRFQEGLWLPRSDARSVVVKYSQTWNL
jgi:hypothetical protein